MRGAPVRSPSRFVRALLAGLVVLVASAGKAQADGPTDPDAEAARYAETLIAKAHELRLAERKQWLRLGHYRPGLLGTSSEADGRDFFLAKSGASDPSAELDATLRGFFKPPSYETGTPPQHPL